MKRNGFAPLVIILAVALVAIVGGGLWYRSSHKNSALTDLQNTENKNLPSVAVEFGVIPDPMAMGKEYPINWRAGKDISSVEIDLASPSSNGDSVYLEKSAHDQGTFQWKVPSASSTSNSLLEGEYTFTIIGKTADYDATRSRMDEISHEKNPTDAERQEYGVLQEKIKGMIATNQSAPFSVLEKEIPKTPSDSLSRISSTDGFEIRYEWQTLPAGLAVGDQVKFIYKSISAMVRGCVISKDEANNVFFCFIQWSDRISDYAKKENWAVFIDGSVSGTAAERDQKRIKDIQQLAKAVEVYKEKNGTYPCKKGACADQSSVYGQSNVVFPMFEGVHYEDPLGEKDKNFEYMYGSDAKGYQVYAELENSFQDNDADFYCVDSLGAKKVISERPLSLSCESKLRPGQTFNNAYRCGYVTDTTSAYHNYGKLVKLPGSDPATFHNVQNQNSCVALDKNQIYLLDDVILPGADPATFEVLGNGNYAKDKNHVYKLYPTPIGIVDGADPKTFTPQ